MRILLAAIAALLVAPDGALAQQPSPLLRASPAVAADLKPSSRTHVETEGPLQVWKAVVGGHSRLLQRLDGRTTALPLALDAGAAFDVGPRTGGGALVGFVSGEALWTYDLRAGKLLEGTIGADGDALSVGGCRTLGASESADLTVAFLGRGCSAPAGWSLDGEERGADLATDRAFVVLGATGAGSTDLVVRRFASGAKAKVLRRLPDRGCVPVITGVEVLRSRVVWLQRTGCRRALTGYAMPVNGGPIKRLKSLPRVLQGVTAPVERSDDCQDKDDPDHPDCYSGGGLARAADAPSSPLLDAPPAVDPGRKPSARTHVETEGSLQVWMAQVNGARRLLSRIGGRTRALPLRVSESAFDVGPRTGGGALVTFVHASGVWTYDVTEGELAGPPLVGGNDPTGSDPYLDTASASAAGCRSAVATANLEIDIKVGTRSCAARAFYTLPGSNTQIEVGLDRMFVVQQDISGHDTALFVQRFAAARPKVLMRLASTLRRTYYCVPAIRAVEVLGSRVVWLQRTACGKRVDAYAMPVAGGRITKLAPSRWPRVLQHVKVPAEHAPNCLVVDCEAP